MAHFRKTPDQQNAQLDTYSDSTEREQLVLMLGKATDIDLFWDGPEEYGPPVVETRSPHLLTVLARPKAQPGNLYTYTLKTNEIRTGSTTVSARHLDPRAYQPGYIPGYRNPNASYNDAKSVETFSSSTPYSSPSSLAPARADLSVMVLGHDYKMDDASWANLTYSGSLKGIEWTSMRESGCAPTSLAIVLDYLTRLEPERLELCATHGVTPKHTMEYAGRYGRASDNGKPNGTSDKRMMSHLHLFSPGFRGMEVSLAEAYSRLRIGDGPLIILAHQITVYHLDKRGNRMNKGYPNGHYMVLVGAEHDRQTFWIADPGGPSRYVDAEQLEKHARIWRVFRE
jgi:hypothetical protein